jgi:adenosylmethionine-8-amino-7-oxononanoate aminotransferase
MSSLADRDLAVFWHPCAQMRDYRDAPPLEIVEARGTRLVLSDGREVLDAISSWWCKSLGHGHAGVRASVERQLMRFEHVIAAQTTHAGLVELCERLLCMANGGPPSRWGPRVAGAAVTPEPAGHFGKVFLADNGSTAVEIALKMALQAQAQRGHPRRTRFGALANGYHGETVGALSVGDLGLYADPYLPLMFPVTKLGPIPYRSGRDDPRWLDAGDEWPAIEAMLTPVASTLAAIIYEPVLQAAGGMRLYSPDLLRRLRRFADENDIFLIADEIAAGMGRLGTMLAGQLATDVASGARDVQPDFAVLSKGLTAGFLPLSAVLTTNRIYDLFDGDWADRRAFLHSNTHTGNALAIAAALGALDAYATEGVLEHVAVQGPRLLAAVSDATVRLASLARPRGIGMVAAVDLRARDGRRLEPAARTGMRVCREAVARGVLLRPLGDTLYLFPPLNCPPTDLDAMVATLAESVAAVVGIR